MTGKAPRSPAVPRTAPTEGGCTGNLEPLREKCPVCHSPAGTECANTITPGNPLPGRRFHFARQEGT